MRPSVKGVLLVGPVREVKSHLRRGALDAGTLEKRLSLETRDLLEQTVQPSSWYPLAALGELLRLLRDEIGGGSDDYLVEQGRRSAEVLRDAGTYQQFEMAARSSGQLHAGSAREEVEREFRRTTRRLLALYQLFYDFGECRVEPLWSDDRLAGYALEMCVVESYPEELRHANRGFHQVLGELTLGGPVEVATQRPAPGRIDVRVERRLRSAPR